MNVTKIPLTKREQPVITEAESSSMHIVESFMLLRMAVLEHMDLRDDGGHPKDVSAVRVHIGRCAPTTDAFVEFDVRGHDEAQEAARKLKGMTEFHIAETMVVVDRAMMKTVRGRLAGRDPT